jgi:hypothetical protein
MLGIVIYSIYGLMDMRENRWCTFIEEIDGFRFSFREIIF